MYAKFELGHVEQRREVEGWGGVGGGGGEISGAICLGSGVNYTKEDMKSLGLQRISTQRPLVVV